MKNLISILIIIALFSTTLNAQRFQDRKHKVPDRIMQLEKIKLIETLEMDEETTLKFFARKSESDRKAEEIQKAIDEKLDIMEQLLNRDNSLDEEFNTALSELNFMHQQLVETKTNFINSLDDFLSYKQIAKLVLFERKFREELRRAIFKDRIKKKKE
ncbi:MAG: hypothetical protein HKM87_03990 [Ignavibacteriaceae bacterium]|nr:hypothetical protein [Ignavibacteriaceae bacterium]